MLDKVLSQLDCFPQITEFIKNFGDNKRQGLIEICKKLEYKRIKKSEVVLIDKGDWNNRFYIVMSGKMTR